ncbi:hypothetical protein, partial [Bosea sp. ASV33]|uniref:hypothetical protein n=1 Tax=Bosea sp. ASV33 TaxID=2795106 RepID=UPI0018EC4A5F
ALAELKARIEPQEPEDTLPPAPKQSGPQIVAAPGEMPMLSGPSLSVRNSLGLLPSQVQPVRNGTAAAHIPGDPVAH